MSTNESLMPAWADEVQRRRTFAIISHPDAGKTTLTEKLLLFGGAIRMAGTVKGRKVGKFATSDWMEIEKQRGISVTSSVMQFDYDGFRVNILDTPGHQDFSEDTYRTLMAADAAVMLIDCAKGVEAQTIKLFQVCRKRNIPIFTFVNKLDREGRSPFDLLEELESVLGIRSCPINWPIGMGKEFFGVYDRKFKQVERFESEKSAVQLAEISAIEAEAAEGTEDEEKVAKVVARVKNQVAVIPVKGWDDPQWKAFLPEHQINQLQEELELLDVAGDQFDMDKVLNGELTPVFFGSAVNNFGVQTFLEHFLKLAPAPQVKTSTQGQDVQPTDEAFSGFVFKIQANMNPAHRDRVAFLRVVSGKFERGMSVKHARLGKDIKLNQPTQFLAQDRQIVENAFAGDIIGLFDPGVFRIGDTLHSGNKPIAYEELPTFSPELFCKVSVKNALKHKQYQKGIDQLTEEGTIQVFRTMDRLEEPIIGVVGQLQFEVFEYRMRNEYGVELLLQRLPFSMARWITGADPEPSKFRIHSMLVKDKRGYSVALFESEYSMYTAREKYPDAQFLSVSPL